ncbi:MAG TPA: HPr family phosphocarrier protein [Candidatus Paceibacterota bacterium]|nr:HPr family phosphocarrier protein [Candidatus Paceibacterota bacterium]HRZ54916.1 HPr family phosphocarrier protein [Candidatus Paceibacterota bacterium]
MKTTKVIVPWREGLHARPAAGLVRRIQNLRSRILLRVGQRVADGRSILAVLTLCAVCNTAIEIQASGEDEDLAIKVVESMFVDVACDDQQAAEGEGPAETGALPESN